MAEVPAGCPSCGHPLGHHDQPDCWECSNAGAICDLAVEITKERVRFLFGVGPGDMFLEAGEQRG